MKMTKTAMIMLLVLFASLARAQFDDTEEAQEPTTGTSAEVKLKPQVRQVTSDELKALAQAFKSKSEEQLLSAAAKILGKDANNLQALNTLGVYYFETGKPGLAKIIINRALTAHPNIPALHNNLGIIFLQEGKQRQAIASFKRSLQIQTDYQTGATNLASIYLEYQDYTKALDPLEDAYKSSKSARDKGDVAAIEIANNYAVALAGTGDLKQAERVFEGLEKADTKNWKVLLNYSILLVERLNSKKKGAAVLNKLKFVSDDSQVLSRVQALEEKLKTLE